MKYLIILCLLIASCAGVKYSYELVSPINSKSLAYSNDTISIEFIIKETEPADINFTIKNKLQTPIKIMWDDASCSINGYTYKIFHRGAKFTEREKSMPPTNVAPNQFLKDVLAPTETVTLKCNKYNCEWVTKPFLPKYHDPKYSNNSIVILMPVKINDIVTNLVYEIKASFK